MPRQLVYTRSPWNRWDLANRPEYFEYTNMHSDVQLHVPCNMQQILNLTFSLLLSLALSSAIRSRVARITRVSEQLKLLHSNNGCARAPTAFESAFLLLKCRADPPSELEAPSTHGIVGTYPNCSQWTHTRAALHANECSRLYEATCLPHTRSLPQQRSASQVGARGVMIVVVVGPRVLHQAD